VSDVRAGSHPAPIPGARHLQVLAGVVAPGWVKRTVQRTHPGHAPLAAVLPAAFGGLELNSLPSKELPVSGYSADVREVHETNASSLGIVDSAPPRLAMPEGHGPIGHRLRLPAASSPAQTCRY